ncbi:MAG: hypothetical protein AMS17_05705 [Spirochaetes bacterium DG_61]|nr:MAG: hypothetical protein AMS17_05705 [Spirochaetes bacterium DG_61]
MHEYTFYRALLVSWFFVAAVTFIVLLFIPAPYGRHSRSGWGPSIQTRFGWMIMEAISPLFFTLFFFLDNKGISPVTFFFLCLWLMHYIQRSFLYPFLIKNGKKPMALSVVGMAIVFNVVNTYLNGRALTLFSHSYALSWTRDPRFIIGLLLFFGGFFINIHSDALLRRLRITGSETYKVPVGGLFTFVSSANYFGEIIEWYGWACLAWSLAGLSFAVWTTANLVPRALAHHNWYRKTFADYPKRRKAIVPFLL